MRQEEEEQNLNGVAKSWFTIYLSTRWILDCGHTQDSTLAPSPDVNNLILRPPWPRNGDNE